MRAAAMAANPPMTKMDTMAEAARMSLVRQGVPAGSCTMSRTEGEKSWRTLPAAQRA